MKSDQSLLVACRRGDPAAWARLLDRYERLVYSIPINFGLSRVDADDVAQATFAALLRSLDAIEQEERLGAWLGTVARRQTWRLVERRRREAPDAGALLDTPVSHDDLHASTERMEWLHQGLVQLGGKCRDLLTALYFSPSEPSYVEISTQLSIPVGSIGPTRARCLAKLRDLLDEAPTS